MATGSLSIPRIFHRIWLGGTMPEEFVRYGRSFEALNPGWEMRLWTERNLPKLHNQAAFDAAKSFAQKADILRYELIFEHGGVYLDTDFECKRALDSLLAGVTAFSATEDAQWISIGILGAVPRHPLFGAVIEELPRSLASQPDAAVNVQTGPLLFTRVVTARRLRQQDPDFVIFPPKLFYPYGPGEMQRKGEAFPEAYAVHHWAGSWLTTPPDAGAKGPKVEHSAAPASGGEPNSASTADTGRLRLLVGFDPDAPGAALSLLVTFRDLFTPEDPVELGVYAYAEPSLPLLECIQQLLRLLVGDPNAMAQLSLYSRAELSRTPYAAAFFPTGNALGDATALSRALSALHGFRAQIDQARGRSPKIALPPPPSRALLLDQALRRPAATAPAAPSPTLPAGPKAADFRPTPGEPAGLEGAAATYPGLFGTALGNGRMLIRTRTGFPLLCSADDLSLTPELLLRGQYDGPLTRFLEVRLAPGQVAFDVGANIGLFSVIMARAVGASGHVVAYEALAKNFGLLRDNLAMNYLSERCTLLECAAWSDERELTFHAPTQFLGNGSVRTNVAEYAARYPGDVLHTLTVRAVPASLELGRFAAVALAKIDVEGGEYQVLLGMRDAIESGRLRTVVFECLRSLLGDDFAPLVRLLGDWERRLGLRCHTIDAQGRLHALALAELERQGSFTQVVLERDE